jgi:hypothetical protein
MNEARSLLTAVLATAEWRTMNTDEIYQLIDDTACMLRGMTLDPAIPAHAKGAMQTKIQVLEEALEKLALELGG